ncbi:hypothetical protein BKA93DRAFT_877032 [Sparassis latifolia]
MSIAQTPSTSVGLDHEIVVVVVLSTFFPASHGCNCGSRIAPVRRMWISEQSQNLEGIDQGKYRVIIVCKAWEPSASYIGTYPSPPIISFNTGSLDPSVLQLPAMVQGAQSTDNYGYSVEMAGTGYEVKKGDEDTNSGIPTVLRLSIIPEKLLHGDKACLVTGKEHVCYFSSGQR